MKMQTVKSWVVAGAVVATSLLASSEAGATSVKIMGAGNLLFNHMTPNNTGVTIDSSSGKFGFGGGASVVFGGPVVGLEVGASYLTSEGSLTYSQGGVPGTLAVKYSYLQLPVLFRFNLGRVLSVGVGGYYNKHLGKFSATQNGVLAESAYDDATANMPVKGSDFGALASLGFDIPIGASTGLVIDGRYAMGMQEVSLSASDLANGVTWKPANIQAYVGLRFGGSK